MHDTMKRVESFSLAVCRVYVRLKARAETLGSVVAVGIVGIAGGIGVAGCQPDSAKGVSAVSRSAHGEVSRQDMPASSAQTRPSASAIASAVPLPSTSSASTVEFTFLSCSTGSDDSAVRDGDKNAAYGSEKETPYRACPSEMAMVGRVCVDKWEGHLVTRHADGSAVVHSPYERVQPGVVYYARSRADVVPQAYISRNEAFAACKASCKRLCTLAEWYRACTGSKGYRYPYGPTVMADICNAGKPHLLSRLYGRNSRLWKYDEHFNNPELNQQPGFLARTGQYSECVSDYGVFDMVGNLHEWISDSVGPKIEGQIPLRDDIRDKLEKRAGNSIFMGGFYSTTSEHGRGCAFITIGHEATYHDYSTGFRCCKDVAKPTASRLKK